jgi:sulfoxide reductase heme-binding subunit YedZ
MSSLATRSPSPPDRRPERQAESPLGRPLGAGRGWRPRLLLHHGPLALTSAAFLVAFMVLPAFTTSEGHGDIFSNVLPQQRDGGPPGSRTALSQFTVASGYLALLFLALTLLIGPANLLLRRRNPISTYLTRDVGIWVAIATVAHVIPGLRVHSAVAGFLDYFVADGRPLTNSFGLGNWTGLAAVVIVVGLLAISTDRSLRELKARRWKDLQRLNYLLFALVVLHVFCYGALLRMTSPFTLLFVFSVIAVLAGQLVGVWLYRRRRSRTAAGGVVGVGDARIPEPSVTDPGAPESR